MFIDKKYITISTGYHACTECQPKLYLSWFITKPSKKYNWNDHHTLYIMFTLLNLIKINIEFKWGYIK